VQKNQNRSGLAASSHNVRHQRRGPVPLPEVVSSDVLATMLDEDLLVRFRALDDERMRVEASHADTRRWEEEVAYLRREQQMRRVRRDAHTAYVRKYEEEFNALEASLPAGDFDNSAFVYAATGGRPRWS
jgi:hypothetical protein